MLLLYNVADAVVDKTSDACWVIWMQLSKGVIIVLFQVTQRIFCRERGIEREGERDRERESEKNARVEWSEEDNTIQRQISMATYFTITTLSAHQVLHYNMRFFFFFP